MPLIPTLTDDLQNDFVFEEPTSKTFKLNIESNTIYGTADELEAMKQAVFLILNTERYEHIIYSWDYGIELNDLIGQEIGFVLPELKRRITEALLWDSRITGVDEFEFETSKKQVLAKFTVSTIFGDINAGKVVEI